MARGLESAGFEHAGLVEWNKDACKTLRCNFSPDLVHETDIRQFSFDFAKGVDVIAGGPPCQPFSICGKHKGNTDDRDMFPVVGRAIAQLLPKAFLFENVKGLLRSSFSKYFNYIVLRLTYPECNTAEGQGWEQHLKELERIHTSGKYKGPKYNVVYRLLNAADYGVPQTRERVIVVGIRDDLGVEWTFPDKTHSLDALLWTQFVTGEYWDRHDATPADSAAFDKRMQDRIAKVKTKFGLFEPCDRPWQTVRDCLSSVPVPTLKPTRRGEHVLREGARIYPGHTGSLIDLPAKTLKAGDHGVPGGENMIRFHDGSVRYFSTYEAKLIQSFPKSYHITGSWTEAMRQIGNAVPVTLSHRLSTDLLECIG